MSTYSGLVSGIKARLDLVTDIGVTHAYQRFAAAMDAYLDQFKWNDQIRGWMVTLAPSGTISAERIMPQQVQRTYMFQVIGVMSLSDEANTEQIFLDLVEAVMNSLENQTDLGVPGVYHINAISMPIYQLRMFGANLCHYCELSIEVLVDLTV